MVKDSPNTMIIVCFSSVPWHGLWQRHQQIMSRLARKGFKVIYIEPTGILEFVKNPRSILHAIQEIKPGIIRVKPYYFPYHYYLALSLLFDKVKVSCILRGLLKKLKIDHVDIIWFFSPNFYPLLPNLQRSLLVYDCADESEGFYSSSIVKRWVLKEEERILTDADLVFVTSDNLYRRCKKHNDDVYYAPNGVSKTFFNEWKDSPPILPSLPRPIIGYIGSISSWLDYDLIYNTAKANQSLSFVFVGPIHVSKKIVTQIQSLNNCYFLGPINYDDVPNYIKTFDVCLLPFVINDLTNSASPLKLIEYFALEKPVVSTRITEVEKYSDLVYIGNHEDFSEQIFAALKESDLKKKEMRRAVAQAHEWSHTVDTIENQVVAYLTRSSG